MIQRNLWRASRHIAPRISQRTLITPPRQSPAFIRLPALQPPSTRLSSRWYSDSADAKKTLKENGDASDVSKSSEKSSSPSESQPSEVQTLKVELEAKNKEIIDLKVMPSPQHNYDFPNNATRTSISVLSQTTATYKTARNAKCNPRETLPCKTSQKTSSPASTTSSMHWALFPPSAFPRLLLHHRTPCPQTSYKRYTKTLFHCIKGCN